MPGRDSGVGVVAEEGVAAAFQFRLAAFEPQTKGQEPIHEPSFFEDRRTWLYTVNSGIPSSCA
jgi:hypothetical protein